MKKFISVFLVVCLLVATLPPMVISVAYENTHTNTSNQAYDIVEVARTQIGY